MEINWLGHACFRIRGKEATLIIDPYVPSNGYTLGKYTADILLISHQHQGHNNIEAVGGSPHVVSGPGEYEIKDVLITGIDSFHDQEHGKKLGHNTIYVMHVDDLTLCHLGDLGTPLTPTQQEEVTDIDVLMVPVGGGSTLDAAQAAEVISQAEPKYIIPMHYATPATAGKIEGLDPLEKFCHEMGIEACEPQPKLVVNRASLPEQPQVVVLTYRS